MDGFAISKNDWSAPAAGSGMVRFERDAQGQIPPAEIAKQFEQIFVQQLLREMSKSLDGGFYGEGSGSHVYQGLFETVLADKIASQNGIGIAPSVEKSMSAQMLAAQPERLFRPGMTGEEPQ